MISLAIMAFLPTRAAKTETGIDGVEPGSLVAACSWVLTPLSNPILSDYSTDALMWINPDALRGPAVAKAKTGADEDALTGFHRG
jgi:hypothetical protein